MTTYAYPEDTTGLAPSNKVLQEPQILTVENHLTYRTIVPTFAPFYLNNLEVRHVVGNSSVLLDKDVDYTVCLPYLGASDMVGKLIYGGLNILNDNIQGVILVTYQTLGGKWVADPAWIAERLADQINNVRTIAWDQITDVQEIFPPVDHHQHFEDLTGQRELVDKLEDIRVTMIDLSENGSPSLADHIMDPDAHNPTKATVGLGDVSNIKTATDQEVLDIYAGTLLEDRHLTGRQIVDLIRHMRTNP
jgi:hypothetical protein